MKQWVVAISRQTHYGTHDGTLLESEQRLHRLEMRGNRVPLHDWRRWRRVREAAVRCTRDVARKLRSATTRP